MEGGEIIFTKNDRTQATYFIDEVWEKPGLNCLQVKVPPSRKEDKDDSSSSNDYFWPGVLGVCGSPFS